MSIAIWNKSSQLGRISGAALNHKIRVMSNNSAENKNDYSRFLSPFGSSRKPSLLREIASAAAKAPPGTVIMSAGFPNAELFPFREITCQLDEKTSLRLDGKLLTQSLQYQPTMGYPPLLETLGRMQKHYHNPPNWDKTGIIVTVGSQHALSTLIDLMLSPGDPIIVPDPAYSSIFTVMDPHSPVYLAVPTDANGMQPSLLKSILDKWISSNSHEKRPKILYLNPTGTNPSGMNTSTARKKEIYKIAQEYDLLILEDDPYYFLHFEHENPTSLLSMDVDGRVIRLDSFSKIISAGFRIGFATGPTELIRRIEMVLQGSVIGAASISQVLVDGILRQWDFPGFDSHTQKVKELYRKRRDLMVLAAKKHLDGLAEWEVPKGGMFLWIKVLGVKDTYKMVMEQGMKVGITLLPGGVCFADRTQQSPYLRASFSTVTTEEMDKGFERLATVIREEQKRQG
jgi:kynurenine/2-aminoadipate aminotransferase